MYVMGCNRNASSAEYEPAKKDEINILPAQDTTRPGAQASALWLERRRFRKAYLAHDNHHSRSLNQPSSGLHLFMPLFL